MPEVPQILVRVPDLDGAQQQQIIDWLFARNTDLMAREFERSLATVGGDRKPLGSYSFGLRGEAIAAQARAKARGLAVTLDKPKGLNDWWVYAWDREALQALLNANSKVLRSRRWPTGATQFVARMRRKPVKPKTALFDLIADVYGDKTGPGRTDVVPGVDPHHLLEAFMGSFGGPDPHQVYFSIHGRKR